MRTRAAQSASLSAGSSRAETTRATPTTRSSRISTILAFEVTTSATVTFGGEYLYAINDFLEAGVGVGYYQKTVHSVYANFVEHERLRDPAGPQTADVPFTATVRFLPVGRTGPVAALRRRRRGDYQLALSGDRRLRRLHRQQHLHRRTRSSPTERRSALSCSRGVRFPVGDPCGSAAKCAGRGRPATRRSRQRFPRRQDRPRRHRGSVHDSLPVLSCKRWF